MCQRLTHYNLCVMVNIIYVCQSDDDYLITETNRIAWGSKEE